MAAHPIAHHSALTLLVGTAAYLLVASTALHLVALTATHIAHHLASAALRIARILAHKSPGTVEDPVEAKV